ncbi:hypothetical protein EI42_02303 [Thermosporothrix hazakensis]|jgi:hypothetical protein|uniref:Uncharacterized protein n=1 Tax=Thermosporothrix hazakensis TaxID=644383 RepID=A0A326U982_THEHA|nr:hypothetical protein EI42_02303 [Thermosporothrix hazakensis]
MGDKKGEEWCNPSLTFHFSREWIRIVITMASAHIQGRRLSSCAALPIPGVALSR